MIEFNPGFGQHIDAAAKEACALAVSGADQVRFVFNGIEVIVSPDEIPEDVSRRWEVGCEAASAAYRASAEYAAHEAQRKRQAILDQTRMDHLISCLPRAIQKGERDIVRWCRDFIPLNDSGAVTCDRATVAAQIASAGYAPGDCVHHPEVQTDRRIMARWLVGQVLEGLVSHGGLMHPIMARFADDYLKM